MNFSIFGAGAWGTAMAIHLARLQHTVTLVPRRLEHALELAQSRENRDYLPGCRLDDSIQIGLEPGPVIMETEVVIIACPSAYLRHVCQSLAAELEDSWRLSAVITLCKGLERETNLLPHQVVSAELPSLPAGCLSGPSYAAEVANGKPGAVVLALPREHQETATAIQEAMSSQNLRLYTSDDVVGVETGGALKNVYAIAAGVCDGLKLGDNARAGLITRMLAEMSRVGTALGGRMETFYGLSGVGDLIATCTGSWSRNRTFGQLIAEGIGIDELIHQRAMTVEGYRAVACFHELCLARGIDAPVLTQVHNLLYNGASPAATIASLMSRSLKAEG